MVSNNYIKSMAKKPTEKKPTKKNLPPNVQVKEFHIDLSPRKWISPIILVLLIASLIWSYARGNSGITYNDSVGINTIQANYASGIYEEIIIAGNQIQAKKVPTTNIVNGKQVEKQEIDRSQLPPSTKITDLGLSDPSNTTKVTIKDQTWTSMFAELVPSVF